MYKALILDTVCSDYYLIICEMFSDHTRGNIVDVTPRGDTSYLLVIILNILNSGTGHFMIRDTC